MNINEMTTGQKIATYLSLKAQEESLKNQLKAIEESLKTAMGDANEISENGFVARIVMGNQRKFDTAKFKADHLDVYESYRKDVPTKSFQAFVEG